MASPVPAKSQPLHNFDLPRTLGWSKDGKSTNHPQRRRSVKSPSRRPNPSPSPIRHESPLRDSSPAPESSRGGSGVIEYRRTHHHHNQSNHNQASQFEKRRSSKILIKIHMSNKSEGEEEDKDNPNSNVAKLEQEVDEGSANRENLEVFEQNDDQEKGENEKDEEAKTWNLRPRKSLRRSLNVNGVVKGNCSGVVEKGRAHSPKNHRGGEGEGFEKEKRKLSINVAGYGGGVEKEKRKLSINISLTKEEIEEDIFAFTGSKPARRPRKRSKAAQKHVDYVFPGLWLVGITPDSYKVSESSMKV